MLALALALLAVPASASALGLAITSPEAGATVGKLPTFSGGDLLCLGGEVTVKIYEGASKEEPLAATAKGACGLSWSATSTTALSKQEYTAVATEGPGEESAPVSFLVDPNPPTVVLDDLEHPKYGDQTPSFEGSASEGGTVTVTVEKGTTEMARITAEAPEGGGEWSTAALGTTLDQGEYTASASEESLLGNGPGSSKAIDFTVDTEKPALVLEQLARSRDTTPTFTGTTSEGETEPVVVKIYEGSEGALGTYVETVESGAPSGGAWSAGPAGALVSGTYTAVATEKSSLGNGEGNAEMTFVVDAEAPKLAITQLARSKDTTPMFKGSTTEGESESVVVKIYEGSKGAGGAFKEEVSSGAPSGGGWSAGPAGALVSGTYTAVAKEKSSLGNGEGKAEMVFVVDTEAPQLAITQLARSKDTTPMFKGSTTEGESESVVVKVYEGSKGAGGAFKEEVSSGAPSGGGWSAGPAGALVSGTYTAVAKEKSSLGNGEGKAEMVFVVDTEAPQLVVDQLVRSKDTTPMFKGSTTEGESESVVVKVYEGSKGAAGAFKEEVSSGAPSGGGWSAGPAGALVSGTYTAVAKEKSSLGNGEGKAEMVFVVDAEAPQLAITQLARSKDTTPTFKGTTSEGETEPVVVKIYEGAEGAVGTYVETVESGAPAGEAWSAGPAGALVSGTYTAVAKEKSSLGNGEGKAEMVFVVDAVAPQLAITQLARSKDTTPTFKGTTTEGESESVVVKIYEGSKGAAGAFKEEVSSGAPSGGAWSTGAAGALVSGTYTAVAKEKSSLGNGEGKAEMVFVVDTEAPQLVVDQLVRSKDTTPTFKGSTTEGETEAVVLKIYEGSKGAAGAFKEEVSSGAPSGGAWSTGAAGALVSGTYTAVAKEKSSLGNGEGKAEMVFVVDTEAPQLAITQLVRSKDTTPTFKGSTTEGESESVVVKVYEGSKGAAGAFKEEVSSGAPSGGAWSAGPAGALVSGTYTAVAKEKSSLGNGEGKAEMVFVVDTEAPQLVVDQLVRSKDTTPTFKGSTTEGETEAVVVKVYEGSKGAAGAFKEEVSSGAPSGGGWSAGPAGALVSGTYTAVAKEKSSLGNGEGKAEMVFVVDTEAPQLAITQLARSKDTTPTFKGSTSEGETEPVVVKIYEGAEGAVGTYVETVESGAPASEAWSAGPAGALVSGTYTAVATEKSSLSNGVGEASMVFVVDSEKPQLTITNLGRSNHTEPTFSGTTNEKTPVTVEIYKATTPRTFVESVTGNPSSGSWSAGPPTKALLNASYVAVAKENSELGNSPAELEMDFEVSTTPPEVTLEQPPERSNDTQPTFEGAVSESGSVIVTVYDGTKAEGTVAATVEAHPAEVEWSATLKAPLASGTYTAVATEKSAIGNEPGHSVPRTFVVDTEPPEVSVAQLERSSNTKPSFSGTASESEPVEVKVHEGSGKLGTVVDTIKSSAPVGKAWSTGQVSTALKSGTYTAVATEKSSLSGNKEGEASMTFVVDTEPPEVSVAQLERSSNTKPSFSGTASESEPVEVKVHEGSGKLGTVVDTIKSSAPVGKAWSTGQVSTALKSGTYTAVATEKSSLSGNKEGEASMTFVVDTEPPEVSVAQLERSSNTKPSFSGTASESEPVEVKVYEGSVKSGSPVDTMRSSAPVGKAWSTGQVSTALKSGTYTAVATEKSSLSGNKEGEASMTFVVDTEPPEVSVVQLERSSNTKPSFSGTASESELVEVTVHEGSGKLGTVVDTIKSSAPVGKAWSTGQVSTALKSGTYTAVATEKSSLSGNKEGEASMTFVVDTEPPEVSIVQLERSRDTKPSFSGTASESEPVEVTVHEGSGKLGTVVDTIKSSAPVGKAWSTGQVSTALKSGTYTAVATEKSSLSGNKEGEASMTFVIDTEPPTLTVEQLARSKDATPTFIGTTTDGETEPVVVKIYEGSKGVLGTFKEEVSSGAPSGGAWSAGPAGALVSGTYTAVATEKSSLSGNGEGKAEMTFVVDTGPPAIVVEQLTRSKNTTPTFKGTTTDGETEPVVVKIYEGSKGALGAFKEEVSSGAPSGGAWSAGPAGALVSGTYTAVATEKSSLGNVPGEASMVFVVDTEKPQLTITDLGRSKQTEPTFSGATNEKTAVTVEIYKATSPRTFVESVTGNPSNGAWSAGPVAKALLNASYVAVAKENSELGNSPAEVEMDFEVFTTPPEVSLEQPPERSNVTQPTFKGTVSESGTVTVTVYDGTKAEGTVAASVEAHATEVEWSAALLKTSLVSGTYTAIAVEKSSIGNEPGHSAPRTFVVDTEPPEVSIVQLERSSGTTPGFSGTASESEPVEVKVYEGSTKSGSPVDTVRSSAPVGKAWSTGPVSSALKSGTYTAVATEKSSLSGNKEGEASMTFVIDTGPPEVSIAQLERSSVTKPSFSGATTEAEHEPVEVKVYEGSTKSGSPVDTVKSSAPVGKAWSTGPVSSALGSGTYTAVATEKSSLSGNKEGEASMTFVVDTEPPEVSIVQLERSRDTKPSFSGTASESEPVEVKVYEGSAKSGSPVDTVKSSAPVGKAWSTGPVSSALKSGTYTAVATEKSSLSGNKEGEASMTFVVDTEPPTLTLEKEGPPNEREPVFKGSTNEAGTVVVHVDSGSTEVGSISIEVTKAGSWTSAPFKPQLQSGDYTAHATQVSGLGNGTGASTQVPFEVRTGPPSVTLRTESTLSDDATPSFNGTSSEAGEPVVVHVYSGSTAAGEEVAKAEAEVESQTGDWASGAVSPALSTGTYTAVATQLSSLGNGTGKSEEVHFEIVAGAPNVTLAQPESPSKNTKPTFKGTASEPEEEVEVQIYEGTSASGAQQIATAKGTVSGHEWHSGIPTPELKLPKGSGTFTAIATEKSRVKGVPAGVSGPQHFFIDTLPPKVTLEAPKSPSNDVKPLFGGKRSEGTRVTIEIYEGSSPGGKPIATAVAATGAVGEWVSGEASPALPAGQHSFTAVAHEQSAIGNPEGESEEVHFDVDTNPPEVTLAEPPATTSEAELSFSGKASGPDPVTVDVYSGEGAEGTPVASVEGEVEAETFTTAKVSPALANGPYTAVAEERSALGNPDGVSEEVHFKIESLPPSVATEAASPVDSGSSWVYGSIDPNGGAVTSCNFEYGVTTAYGKKVPCAFNNAAGKGCGFGSGKAECTFPSGETPAAVYARIYSLQASTTYHFRLVASHEGHLGYGADMTFRTPVQPKIEEGQDGSTGVSSSLTHSSLTAAQLKALLKQLAAAGRKGTLRALLSKRGFKEKLTAPEAGTAIVDWYYQAPKAKGKKAKPKPVLVASGKLIFKAAGSSSLVIHVTPAGKRLLARMRSARLTVALSFTPGGGVLAKASETVSVLR